ncbi:MAG: DUF975 family protein [Mediterranea sp.]|jgi:uncharacterized membrane protein|nr:DUF975 family protein [Mediterranea sp.]
MLKQNSELRAEARNALDGQWLMAAAATLIYFIIAGAVSQTFVGIILVVFHLDYGLTVMLWNRLKEGKPVSIDALFDGFREYGRLLGTFALMFVYILLWTLLLVIPGIIKSYSYSMTYFILKDNPGLEGDAAIEKSMAMMHGHKTKLFLLDLSFIGWAILCLFTCGIGFLFLTPYMYTAHAAFYEDLKAQANEQR